MQNCHHSTLIASLIRDVKSMHSEVMWPLLFPRGMRMSITLAAYVVILLVDAWVCWWERERCGEASVQTLPPFWYLLCHPPRYRTAEE